jgi:hypothetical protein
VVRLYQIPGGIATEVLRKAAFNTWRTYLDGKRNVRTIVANYRYRVITTEDAEGNPIEMIILGPGKTVFTVEPPARAEVYAQRLAYLKAEWDKIRPEKGTASWYNKWFAENAADSGQAGTIPYYEAAFAFYNAQMAERTTLEQLENTYEDFLAELTECEGHESLNGAHMGESVYCDGTCR